MVEDEDSGGEAVRRGDRLRPAGAQAVADAVVHVATTGLAPAGPARLEDVARSVEERAGWAESLGEPWVGLVFTGYVRSTRMPWANADSVARAISSRVGSVAVYHGQLGERQRRSIEDAVTRASRGGPGPRVVVATKAFGMGIDIPNIRFVVHAFPSDSVEDYYQEVGRAGRDGKHAIVLAFYDPRDFEVKKRMKMAEAVRPSTALQVYNAIVSAASHSSDGRQALIPIDLLSSVAGSLEAAYRSLEALRQAGLLEYTVVRQPLKIGRGRECLIDLKGGWCIDSEADGPEATAYLCGESPNMKVSYSECPGGKGYTLHNSRAVLVELAPGIKHRPSEYLPLEAFTAILRMRVEEADKVEELKSIMERAARARLRGGRPAANSLIRREIEEYFNRSRRRPDPPRDLLGKRFVCRKPEECIEEIARDTARLAASFGPNGFTVATPSSKLAVKLRASVEAALSRPIDDPRRAYQRKMATLRRKNRSSLMDYGFLLVLVEEGSRSLAAVEPRLAGYPYHALYVIGGEKEK